ncbi:MAG: SDR family oxidoreductase [Acidobacteriota bacterium]|nr:SDR family oxidoreductase [Acidobacteriota bacterium]
MSTSLAGRVAVVTGASRGIGLAIAHRLSAAGALVAVSSRSADHLASAAASFPADAQVLTVVAHAGSSDDAARLVTSTVERFGSLDILVNNAATNPYFGPVLDIDQGRMQKTFEVNVASVISHTGAAWRHWMRDHGGVVLNVASIGGLQPEPGLGWYDVTKAAVIHLTRQLALELAPGVRVNALAPGLVRTEFARALWESDEASASAHIPLGRIGEPDDVAGLALALVSDDTAWVTGQTVVVDGGSTIRPSGGVARD